MIRHSAIASGLLLAAASPAVVRAQQFTLDQVMSAPFSSDMTAATSGATVAWLTNLRGARNVWAAAAPSWTARKVTSYGTDDGQEIESLSLAPDGRTAIYVRGGDANRAGELPNPALIPGGVRRAIWVVRTDAAANPAPPRRLAEGDAPRLSPSGDSVAFVRGGQIWIMRLRGDSGSERALTKLRGHPAELRWSPDGKRLAFTSARQRHSFIGVWDFTTGALRYLDPSTDQDVNPAWSPDGRWIAFARTPSRLSDIIFTPERESPIPWSIRVADASTGATREVWRAKPGPGSVKVPVVSDDQLFWAAGGDRIVFPWESDGWIHLYSVPVAGGDASLLTPGEFEVEYASRTPDAHSMVYSSNQGDTDRRHVWRVPMDGSAAPSPLTSGSGIEQNPAFTSDGAVALIRSDARLPARAAIAAGGVLRDLAPSTIRADFPAAALVEPTQVILHAADGVTVHAQLFQPRTPGTAKRPAVIFFHGGSRRQMLLGWHYMYYDANAYALNQYLANRGYVVLSVNYRSGIGYGLDFREALDYGAGGASEYADVIAAGRYLRTRADVDPARIALWGGSYGGYLTAMGLARNSDMFAAGVDLHGVHDWNSEIPNFVPAYDSLRYDAESKLAYRSSPLASVDGWRSPVLLVHGDDDRNVPFTESVTLAYELRKRGVAVEELIFPDEIHDFLLWRHWVEAYAAAGDFLRRRLAAEQAAR